MPKIKAKAFHSFSLDQCQPVAIDAGMLGKVDHFLMIFDPSASMTEPYAASARCTTCHLEFDDSAFAVGHMESHGGGVLAAEQQDNSILPCLGCHQDYLHTKFKFAKELAMCFNKSIPPVPFIGSLRSFGAPVYTQVAHGPSPYDKAQFDLALQKMIDANGASPLDYTLNNASKDWFAAEGAMAVLIISDGKDMGEPDIMAAKDLAGRYQERVCLYTIHIGDDEAGREVLQKIADAAPCGGAFAGDDLLNNARLTALVRQIFLVQGDAVDSDGDGVVDARDDCPGTLAGTVVDERGCWKLELMADVLFAFDHYDLTDEGVALLDTVADYLKKHPGFTLELSGHTDNIGSQDYNDVLSKRRALAGEEYLISRGIAPKRISSTWHSFNVPAATNETGEGRALNRRIEFKFGKGK